MPGFIAGTIINGLALTGAAAAIVQVGVALAFSAVASALQRKGRSGAESAGIRTKYSGQGDTTPQTIILGRYATAGHKMAPFYSHTKNPGTGSDFGTIGSGDYATFIFNIADVPISSLNAVFVDGTRFDISTHLVGAPHAHYGLSVADDVERDDWVGNLWVKFYDGTQSAVDPYLLAAYGGHSDRPWKSTSVHTGSAYVIVTCKRDETVFSNIPQFLFEVDGMELDGSFTENPVDMIYNIMRGITMPDNQRYGMGVDTADLPSDWWDQARADCLELVENSTGSMEPQYRAGFEIPIATPQNGGLDPLSAIDPLLTSASAQVADLGGQFIIRVGAPSAPVLSITDDNILNSHEQSYTAFQGLAETFNGVSATFPSPDAKWEPIQAPSRVDAAAEAEDGRRLMAALDLNAVPFADQVQRLMKSWVNDAQRRRVHTIVLPAHLDQITVLDTLSLSSDLHGYTNKLFEVQKYTPNLITGAFTLVIREVDPDDFTPSAANYIPQAIPVIPVTRPPALMLENVLAGPYTIIGDNDEPRRSAIVLNWTVPSDNLDGVAWEVYQGGTLVTSGSTPRAGDLRAIISEGLLANTQYTIRATPVAKSRKVDWSSALIVQTPDVTFGVDDFGAAVWGRVEDSAGQQADQVIGNFKQDEFDPFSAQQKIFNNGYRRVHDQLDKHAEAASLGLLNDYAIQRENRDNIAVVEQSVTQEITDRGEAIVGLRTEMLAGIDGAESRIIDETTARTTADSALATDITALQTDLGNANAAIATETAARTTADDAIASDVTALQTGLGNANAAIATETAARTTADSAITSNVTSLTTRIGNVEGVNSTQAGALTSLSTSVSDLDGQVQSQASSITSLTTAQNGHTSTINEHSSSIAGLGASIQFSTNVDGHIAGWALTNQVQGGGNPYASFTFVADNFQISSPNGDVSPFVVRTSPEVIDGVTVPAGTYIDGGMIRVNSLDAITAKIGVIKSSSSGERTEISDDGMRVYNSAGDLVVAIGKLTGLV